MNKRGKINIPNQQKEILRNLGILDSQIDSTIDEKIESIIKWLEEYPAARVSKGQDKYAEIAYTNSADEGKTFKERYNKMQKYYEYIAHRKYNNKLTPEKVEK